jgi:hypothetical protein
MSWALGVMQQVAIQPGEFPWQLAIQVVTVLGGGTAFIGFLKVRADKKKILAEADKTGADASAVVAATAISLLGPYTEQVRVLQERLTEANSQIDNLGVRLREARGRVLALEMQVDALTQELTHLRSA